MADDNCTDEAWANLRETLPRLWWNVYQGSLSAGFNPAQSFVLLQTYILAQGTGIQPPKETGPKADDGSDS